MGDGGTNGGDLRRITLSVLVLVQVVNADVLTRREDDNANDRTPLPLRRIDTAIMNVLFNNITALLPAKILGKQYFYCY